jgi:hypothetical protein
MNSNRIDNLRNLVATIGAKQIKYHHFFPAFAYRFEKEMGIYLGDQNCVALCCAFDEFSFDKSYRHAGLDFEHGKYRIPLMFKLNNLNDVGHTVMRIRMYFTKDGDTLSAHIDGGKPVAFSEADLEPLLNHTYEGLCSFLTDSNWFESHPLDYQSNGIGFSAHI